MDGYCNKTFKWYEAKILEIADMEGIKSIKVHFKGWNSKYDEWLDINSERIQPFGRSQTFLATHLLALKKSCPWYLSEVLHDKIQSDLIGNNITNPTRRTMSVCIHDITDYCIDFTYANPSLWLINKDNTVWYRIAGPMIGMCNDSTVMQSISHSFTPNSKLKRSLEDSVISRNNPQLPGGGYPMSTYSTIFYPGWEAYYTTVHLVFIINDLVSLYTSNTPSNKKKRSKLITYDIIMDELVARTEYQLHEFSVLQHWEFIIEQLKSVDFETVVFVTEIQD